MGLIIGCVITLVFWSIIIIVITAISSAMPKNGKKQNELIKDITNQLNKEVDNYLLTKLIDNQINVSKKVYLGNDKYFIVDDNNKNFTIVEIKKVHSKTDNSSPKLSLTEYLNRLSIQELKVIDVSSLVDKFYNISINNIYTYKDLLKFEVTDMSVVKKTYTMESKTGDALLGAVVGDTLWGGLEGGTVGAIAGSSGKRQITEDTKKATSFQVMLYFNRLDTSNIAVRVNYNHLLRDFISTLEYILNNKEG